MTLVDQIQVYKLEENLQDLVVQILINDVDVYLETMEVHDFDTADKCYQLAWEHAAIVHHKSIQEQVEWLKEHKWPEKDILEELLGQKEGDD